MSPLAEGRELKCFFGAVCYNYKMSPLAEGRELKSEGQFTEGTG